MKNWKVGAVLTLMAAFMMIGLFAGPLMSAINLSQQTAMNRIERYLRPTPHNTFTLDSDTAMTVTWLGDSSTASITIAGSSILGYVDGATTSSGFTKVALASKTVKQVCDTIDAYTYWRCDPFTGGDYYATATYIAPASTVDCTSGGQVTITSSPLKDSKKYGMSIVIDAQGGGVSTYLTSIDPLIDSITTGYLAVYEGNTIKWERRVEDYTAGDNDLTNSHVLFPGPGLVTDANKVVGVRLWAGDTIQAGGAQLSVTAHSYGY